MSDEETFSAEEAAKLIIHCQNVEQARYLIEHAAILGPIHDVLTEQGAQERSDNALMLRYREATGRKMFLDDFRRYLDWFREVGLWSRN
ncbi:hypothetical protein Pan216_14870 [Planctomycetes bacterium Pan216]|uniref:Uncharacterized protein n=1 Tax=Kolteria novifilia TaxID=2527975 RepID=A0A518B0Z4_9BACT|nr:hypothetical protein Pan216_14870 [Planctomycetes bacterium Pan216]